MNRGSFLEKVSSSLARFAIWPLADRSWGRVQSRMWNPSPVQNMHLADGSRDPRGDRSLPDPLHFYQSRDGVPDCCVPAELCLAWKGMGLCCLLEALGCLGLYSAGPESSQLLLTCLCLLTLRILDRTFSLLAASELVARRNGTCSMGWLDGCSK